MPVSDAVEPRIRERDRRVDLLERPSYDARSVPPSIAIDTSASESVPSNRSAVESRPPPVSASVAALVPAPSTWKWPDTVPA